MKENFEARKSTSNAMEEKPNNQKEQGNKKETFFFNYDK
jgi:hypothetical protein